MMPCGVEFVGITICWPYALYMAIFSFAGMVMMQRSLAGLGYIAISLWWCSSMLDTMEIVCVADVLHPLSPAAVKVMSKFPAIG